MNCWADDPGYLSQHSDNSDCYPQSGVHSLRTMPFALAFISRHRLCSSSGVYRVEGFHLGGLSRLRRCGAAPGDHNPTAVE